MSDLIESSDARFRQATTALGVVIANHLLSAADAYLSSPGREAIARIRLIPGQGVRHSGWSVVLSLPVLR